ncbi:MAG: DNA-processing protein DprA [Hyphomicrobiaceae bacterium]
MKTRPLPVPDPRRPLSDRQRLAWLRLIRSENVGPVTFREIVNHFGGAEEALEALPELSRRGGRGRPIRICPKADAEAELARAGKVKATAVAIDEAGYPPLLAATEAPPPILYIKGRPELAAQTAIAIVGARDASAAGRKLAQMIATGLGSAGLVVASGLARGIDTAAHEAALATGTVAVVAGGIDIVYPPENEGLTRRIETDGLVIAENPPGFTPRGQDFPRRNRIISGLSMGVLVVEAAKRSGSHITARFALEQGREVFAVPGHPLDPRAAGTNHLLKQGATLVTETADLIAVIEPMLARPIALPRQAAPPKTPGLTEVAGSDRARVVEALGPAPVGVDDVVRMTGLDARAVRVVLIELDLAGRLERHGGQRVSLVV